MTNQRIHHLVCCGLLLSFTGCTIYQKDDKAKKDIGVAPVDAALAESYAYRDTIGALAYYEGMVPMRVRGYGLVVGLGKNGSAGCPKPVYDRLVQSLYKQHHLSSSVVGVKDITPEQLIADLDTAVVVVQGEIPAAAVEGTRFDVSVMALPGTTTKSLRGGRLYTADLEVFRPLPSGVSMMGQVMAKAAGPVFINPFADGDAATKSSPLEGTIVAGGMVTKDRHVRLVLSGASYSSARGIQERINGRFSGVGRIADATSPSFVQVRVPPNYRNDTAHFLTLVRCLYISHDPQFESARARQLADEIVSPTAPHAMISLCLEGLGRSALPVLDDLYKHPKDYVSFHAAAAGARLEDPIAYDTLAHHAARPNSDFRFQAIRALGDAKGSGASGAALRKLLLDEDPRVQIAAYEALLERNDATVESKVLGGDNFRLDRIPASPTNFVYVKRSGSRRIAVFGSDVRCSPPILYRSPDGAITLNAPPDADSLTVMRTVAASAVSAPTFSLPFDLQRVIEVMGSDAAVDTQGAPTGLALDYGAVVRALYHLCHSDAVNARFILEEPNATELFGPPRPLARPESEL